MLEYQIMELIRDIGPIRGSTKEFSEFFSATENEVNLSLKSLERKGIILKATPLPGSRPAYSYNHHEYSAPAIGINKRYCKRHWMRTKTTEMSERSDLTL